MSDIASAALQQPTIPSSACTALGLIPAVEMSTILQVSTQTLATWRCKKKGPPSIKLGKRVFYLLADFNKWMLSEVQTQREALPAPSTPQPDQPFSMYQSFMQSVGSSFSDDVHLTHEIEEHEDEQRHHVPQT